ncbi:MAG: flippase [Patescibacteria group bacterium]|jgi:O-antigen/teichoic acid export membrane protein
MGLAAKIAQNTFWQIVGKFAGTVLGLITIALMTRYLGREGFGYYTTIISFLQFFGVLIDFGLQMATAQMLSRPGVNQHKIFANILTVRLLSAIVFLGTASALVWFLPYPLAIKLGVGVASFSFFFISLQSVLIGLYQKQMAMAEVAIAEVWGRFILLLGVWLAVMLDWGLLAVIVAVSLGSLVNFLYLVIGARKHLILKLEVDFKVWRQIWDVSWPLAVTISLTLVYFRADTIILSLVRPAEEVGIYGAAYKVLETLIQFPYLFLGLILPLLTEFYLTSKVLFEKTLQKSFDFMAILAVPMVMATWLLAEKIMEFVAGADFVIAAGPLRILIVGAAMIYFGALAGYAIVACGLQKKMIWFYLFDAVFSLAAYLIFIPIFSYWAAAILTLATETVIALSAFYVLRRETKARINLWVLGKSLLASLVMGLCLYPLLNQNILTLVIIGAVIYFLALYLLRGYDKREVMDMIKLKKI